MSQHKKNKLKADVEELLVNSVLEQVLEHTEKILDDAMRNLSESDRALLSQYFDGQSIESLARANRLTVEETTRLITKLKQSCIQYLTRRTQVRQ